MSEIKLDTEEKELLASYEADEWQSVGNKDHTVASGCNLPTHKCFSSNVDLPIFQPSNLPIVRVLPQEIRASNK
jgi:hypothetical protein